MFVPSNVSMKQVTKIPESDLSLFFSNGFSENMRNIIQTSKQKLEKKKHKKKVMMSYLQGLLFWNICVANSEITYIEVLK